MSKVYIQQFKEGMQIKEVLLVANVTKGLTNAGALYLNIEFQDKSGSIDAKLWDAKDEEVELIVPGNLIEVFGDVLLYRNNLQLRVNNIESVVLDYDLADFTKSSKIPRKQLEKEIFEYIEKIDNKILHEITNTLVNDYKNQYFTYPAASRIHHEYIGGLATHVLEMLKLSDSVLALYPYINQDLLYSGIILHDFGKIVELSGPILTQYTLEGRLLGHISLMQAKIFEVAKELNFADSEEITLLRHLILAHHGEYEFGSPVLPMIPEAEILSLIDNLDARCAMLEKAMDNTDTGEFSTRIFYLENRAFFKSNLK